MVMDPRQDEPEWLRALGDKLPQDVRARLKARGREIGEASSQAIFDLVKDAEAGKITTPQACIISFTLGMTAGMVAMGMPPGDVQVAIDKSIDSLVDREAESQLREKKP
jgi:hypothetical protein